jgi:hypothetical protein
MKRFNVFTYFMSPGKMRMIVHPPIETSSLHIDDAKNLAEQVYSIIDQDLKEANVI